MKKLLVVASSMLWSTIQGADNIFCHYSLTQTSNQTRYSAACLKNRAPYPGTLPNPQCTHYTTSGHPNIFMTQHASYCPPGHKPYVKRKHFIRRK